MIDKFHVAKALYDNAKALCDANSLKLVAEGESYETTPSESYVREFVLFGDDDPVGISDNSSDIQFGIYQLTIATAKIEEGCKWKALHFAGILQAGFSRGTVLTSNGQDLRVRNASVVPVDSDETHFMRVLSIRYSVIN